MAGDTFSIQMWYFASQSRIKIPWFLLFIISKARQLLFKEANGQFDVCAWWCVVWVCVRVSAEWQVSELSAVLTHSPPAVFNQYSSEFQPSHMSAHANTHARTDTALQYLSARCRGNTKYEQLHTYAAKCIRSALTYLPPPHTHTRVGECVFICAFLCGCAICACVHNGPEIINSSSWCPPGEQNIKLERETCARVFVCACKRGSREDSEQQLDRFEFTQDGEKMSGDKQKKQ